MIVFPAIDLKDGKCVRLYKGDMKEAVIYNDDPSAQAKIFEEAGFSWLHIIDLNGAIQGRSVNAGNVEKIIKDTKLKTQLGGGIRDMEAIERWLSAGVSRVILGTVALRNPELVIEACKLYPGRIVVGMDARKGKVAVAGWTVDSDMDVAELAARFEGAGVAAIIHTDIDRDGTGKGLNIEATQELASKTKIPVIASGGVATIEDLQKVKDSGLAGVIAGRAVYEDIIPLNDIAGFCR